ncbi:hypothetical protein D3C76_1679720 [compost metagenome]
MPARVPGKELHIRQVQLIDQVGNTPGMLMAAVKQHYAPPLGGFAVGRPVSIIECYAIVGVEAAVLCFAHPALPYW